MKKVLFIISTLNTGGAQRAFSNIIMALPRDWKIEILLNDSEGIIYPYRGTVIDLGLKPQKDKNKIIYQMKVFIKRYFILKKMKKQKNYTACISALESANIVNILSGKKHCKIIVSVRHYNDCNMPLKKIIDLLIRLTYRKADYVIPVSEGIAHNLMDYYRIPSPKIFTIYNGYHISKIHRDALKPCELTHFFQTGENILITSGRLIIEKGIQHLIPIISIVKTKFPNIKLIIMGDGPAKPYLKELIQQYHLEKNIIITGFVNNPFPLLKNSSIFIFPSLREGFPNALAEAIICGLPCISTDCLTGPREILAPGTSYRISWDGSYEKAEYGILCPVFSNKFPISSSTLQAEEKIMATAIIDLLQDKKMYSEYKIMCRKKEQELDIKETVKQWVNIIQ